MGKPHLLTLMYSALDVGTGNVHLGRDAIPTLSIATVLGMQGVPGWGYWLAKGKQGSSKGEERPNMVISVAFLTIV